MHVLLGLLAALLLGPTSLHLPLSSRVGRHLFAAAAQSASASKGVVGTWREPGGSVLQVLPCGADVCAKLTGLSPSVPSKVDGLNPDPALKTRPLCGLQIGTGFHLTDPDHAKDGRLYDPKSGKTYHGAMTAEGDHLHLRGYLGLKAFGRTEEWTRTSEAPTCKS